MAKAETKAKPPAPSAKTRRMAPLNTATDENRIDEAERRAWFLFEATRDTV